jgi:phage/plasmid primase-like uncharacterized protein
MSRDVSLKIPISFPPLPADCRGGLPDANAVHFALYHTPGRGFWACATPCKQLDGHFQVSLCDPRSVTARRLDNAPTRFSAKVQALLESRLRARADILAASMAAGTLTVADLQEALR